MSALERDDLLRPALGIVGSVLVVAGPWLVFVAVFGLAGLRLEPLIGRLALEDLRLTVVYAFALSPLVAAPVASIAARTIDLDSDVTYGSLRGIVISALGLSGLAAMGVAAAIVWALQIAPGDLAIAFVFFSGAVAQLWVIFAVLVARRAYGLLTGGFVGCLCAAAVALLAIARWDTPVSHLVWILYAGLVSYVALALARLTREDPRPPDVIADLRRLLDRLRHHRALALGILCAMAAVWVDKWLMWAGPAGMRTTAGFYHFAPYDTVMFLAHLTTIPAFAALHGFQRSALARAMARVYRRLADGSTAGTVEAELSDASDVIWGGLLSILTLQLAITAGAILLIPRIAPIALLDFNQVLMLRTGLLAVFCHSLLILCSVVLLQTRSTISYLGVNLLMLVLNVSLSLTIPGAATGFFAAALISAIIALALALRETARTVFLIYNG